MATRTRRAVTTFKVQTQLVTIHSRAGERIQKPRKGQWRAWMHFANQARNVAEAIRYVVSKLVNDKVGGIVVLRPYVNGKAQPEYTKIFQAKWGNDKKYFLRFDGLVGEYWMRQMPKPLIQKLRQVRAT